MTRSPGAGRPIDWRRFPPARSWGETRDLSGAMLLTRGGEQTSRPASGTPTVRPDPITPATRFGIASVTKMFTACAVVGLVRDGLVAFETPVVDVLPADRRPSDPAARGHGAPPALPHLGHRRLLRGGRGLPGLPRRLRRPVARAAVVLDDPAGRLPAALRRPAAVPPAGRVLPVLQRRLHRSRSGDRGADRSVLHRRRAAARLRPCRDVVERLLPPRRAGP